MAKDKRIKGCPNLICKRYKKEHKYKVTDNYCTICGTELVYVCAECFEKIEDEGPEKRLCATCEAKHTERKEAVKKGTDKVKNMAKAGVTAVPKAVEFAVSPSGKKLIESGAKILLKKK